MKKRKESLIGSIQNEFLLALDQVDLTMANLAIHGDGREKIVVFDPTQPEGKRKRKGQFFVGLSEVLTKALPGSVLGPKEFLKELGLDAVETSHWIQKLSGQEKGEVNQPVFEHQGENGLFSLKVWHGSTNDYALEISHRATLDFNDPEIRGKYQHKVAQIMTPILNSATNESFQLIFGEDCAASAETIMGTVALMAKKTKIPVNRGIRIDVNNATAQSVLILEKFSQQNELPLTVQVGYLSWGLSGGKEIPNTSAREHANYIIYPEVFLAQLTPKVREIIKLFRAADENIYVVGDMGDAAQSMNKSFDRRYPWNLFRNDPHGDRGMTREIVYQEFDSKKATVVYLANGGYLVSAFRKCLQLDSGLNKVTFSAKRVWSPDERFGYGVLMYGIPKNILHLSA